MSDPIPFEDDAKIPSEKESPYDSPADPSVDEILPEMGYVEELRREFSIWSLGSLCLCLMGTWEALTSMVAAALTNGGAPCLFYN
jgi:hypothetical protein